MVIMDKDNAPHEPDYGGHVPANLTDDPTQGKGTDAWQLSVRHSMEVNARERRN